MANPERPGVHPTGGINQGKEGKLCVKLLVTNTAIDYYFKHFNKTE